MMSKFRIVTLALQIAAILTYFIPPLIIGGSVSVFWLVCGVLNTVLFAAVFFRDSGSRVVLSVFLMIFNICWCMGLLCFVGLVVLFEVGFSFSPLIFLYILLALLASIFSLVCPRKYV